MFPNIKKITTQLKFVKILVFGNLEKALYLYNAQT